jgi:predicted alpha-1,6-mannanase (GH76 family)
MGKYRYRADAAIAVLHSFYDDAKGLWRDPPTGWWNSANALEATIDYSARTGTPTYMNVIANTFARNNTNGFLNQFFDDEGWWALAWLKAFDLTKDRRYLAAAQRIFDDMCRGWDATCGGGIWWNKPHDKKNAIANELFLTVAARLHARAPGNGASGSPLDWAQRTWTWFDASGMINATNLINDGLTPTCTNDGKETWTYNQGVILGGLIALNAANGDATLLRRAQDIANAAIANLTVGGILHEPAQDLGIDGPQFKGVFVRNLSELYAKTSDPAYRDFILVNANAMWSRSRNADCACGAVWQGPFDKADGTRQGSALDLLNAALPFDTPGTTYQAESATLQDLSSESTHPDFHGTGYVAGWNRDGQAVSIGVDVPAAGLYDLVLRYAAVGDASRCVKVNGTIAAPNARFPATGDWSRWSTAAVYDAPLDAGSNTITVALEGIHGNGGWLNLDELTVQ